ncbi:MAG: hypothetical protein BWZ09_02748 [Alphaproteobacteria bacterium ADurb.BinA305]|nr:MAG: hypothetical protein BWZ09_02748 [Alphaproteobacteria bacterium ADurb.BinA305]
MTGFSGSHAPTVSRASRSATTAFMALPVQLIGIVPPSRLVTTAKPEATCEIARCHSSLLRGSARHGVT